MSDGIWREMAQYMKIGDRVVRGKNWIYDDHDGNGPGTITQVFTDSLNFHTLKFDPEIGLYLLAGIILVLFCTNSVERFIVD